jgi:hypothetical protein
MAWLLGNSARTAAATNWARAYRALVSNPGSPARIASFRLATRNLSNTLEVPLERITERILFRSGQADQGPEQQ